MMPTQPWLSVLIHPCKGKKSPRAPPQVNESAEGLEAITVDTKAPRYQKEVQNFCIIESSFASRSPSEYCRKNGFEKPLNLFQLLSWVFFGSDILLFYIFSAFSLSTAAAVSDVPCSHRFPSSDSFWHCLRLYCSWHPGLRVHRHIE